MTHSPEQMRQKEKAMREATHHAKGSTVDGSPKRYKTEGMNAKETYDSEEESIKHHSPEEDTYGEAIHRRVLKEANK